MEILRKSVTVKARYWMCFQVRNSLRQPGGSGEGREVLLSWQSFFLFCLGKHAARQEVTVWEKIVLKLTM